MLTPALRCLRALPVLLAVLGALTIACGSTSSASHTPGAPPAGADGATVEVAGDVPGGEPATVPGDPAATGHGDTPGGRPPPGAEHPPGWHQGTSDGGRYELAWWPVGGSVPRNQEFALDVLLTREGGACDDASLALRGWMPEHGHGLVRAPHITNLGGGRFHVEGVLLHMRGRWQLFFDIASEAGADSVPFELNL